MKITPQRFVKRASVVAVRGALAAMVMIPGAYAADAPDPAVAELTQPTSTIEVGVGDVTQSSFKFGEYNGLEHRGPYAIGNFDLRGGDSYDSGGTFRWRAFGTDVGLRDRNLGAEVGSQGNYRLKYDYDEIRRNFSDSFQTFYSGAGGTALTIPAFAGIPAASRGSSATTATGALSNWQNIQSPYATPACATTGGVPTAACSGPGVLIPPAMQNFNIETQRRKNTLDYTQELLPGWQFKASARNEDKDGTQLTGVAYGGPARGVLVPAPISTTTDQYRASLGYVGGNAFATLAYTGSFFKNNVQKWTVENPFNNGLLAASFGNAAFMQGMPDNEMHQISLSGGYNFTPMTRLVVSGHYQRMTDDKHFLTGLPTTWFLADNSPHAKVNDTTLNATLTARPVKELGLTVVAKYDDRDPKTDSRNWLFQGGDAATAPSLFTNRNIEFKTAQFNFDADYAIAKRQTIKAGYEYKQVKRTLSDLPDFPAEAEAPVDSDKTTENTFKLGYRNNVLPNINGRIDYAYSQRRASDYEAGDSKPVTDTTVYPVTIGGKATTATFPAADPALPGFRQFWLADRDRDRARGTLNLQPTDAASLQAGVEYTNDDYKNSQWGVKNTRAWTFNLDGAFVASDSLTFNAFYTYEDKKQQLDSLVISRFSSTTQATTTAAGFPYLFPHTACTPFASNIGQTGATTFGGIPADFTTDPCRAWSEQQSDKVHTIGLGVKAKGLLGGKFDLDGTVAYQRATTPISVNGSAYFANGATGLAANNVIVPAQSFPDILAESIEWRVNARYAIDKASAVRVTYIYKHLKSNDWQWDAYTNSSLGVLAIPAFPGVGITSPNYDVQVVGVSYIYSFK
jgi:MtrB/PioB family decaheme-associated outer membrane protein